MSTAQSKAIAEFQSSADAILLKIGGIWRLTEVLPQLDDVMPRETDGRPIRAVPSELLEWDSSLPLFLLRVRSRCLEQRASLDLDALPDALKRLCRLILESDESKPGIKTPPPEAHPILNTALRMASNWKDAIRFIGECCIGTLQAFSDSRRFSWKDFFVEIVGAGPKALPIVGLLSFLIGVTFAFETSSQLRNFGAQIYVIDAVSVAMLRQIAPVIAAVVLAGRTGASFAARLGDMKLGGEIDAIEVLGVSPISYLVLPRLAALVLMMPLITLYADLLGVLGGFVVSISTLNIPVMEFWVRLESVVSLNDLRIGVVKGIVFGLLVGLAGTWRGLRAERSSAGVGRAVTSAVVTGIASIIVADALFAPILKDLGF